MSTIGSLLGLMDPGVLPYNAQELTENRIRGGNIQNQTGLLDLIELRRQQEAAAQARAYLQQNPGALGGGEGGPQSTLGGMAPGAPPMMQQQTMPGQPPGPPQMVPGGQDLSRFAGGTPPQSMLGGMAPQQGPPQGNPMEALMRQNPDAALQVMDLQAKRQGQQLTMRAKMAEYMGSVLQGVTSQDSLEEARREVARVAPEWAQRLPQTYSAEAIQPFIERALSVKDKATLQIDDLQAQAALAQARRSGRVPTTDQYLTTLGVVPGQERPEDMRRALTEQTNDQARVQAAQSENSARITANMERTEKPLEGEAAKAVSDLTTLRTMTDDLAKLYKPDYSGPVTGRTGYLREQAGRMAPQETAFRRTAGDIADILARLRTGAAFPASEQARLERLAPGPNDPPEVFQAKLQSFQRSLEQMRESRLRTGTTGREQLREETRPATPLVSGSAAPATGPLPPVSGMSHEELLAERARLRGGR